MILSSDQCRKTLGSQIKRDFFENGKIAKEAVLETCFNFYFTYTTNGRIKVIKLGWTDGYISILDEDGNVLFSGIQETKRDVGPTYKQIAKQIIQAMFYYYNLSSDLQEQSTFFVLNSAKFISYVTVKDLQELLSILRISIVNSPVSASKFCKEFPAILDAVSKWVHAHYDIFHVHELTDDFEFSDFCCDLCNNCKIA